MKQPLVSIIVTTFNSEKTLASCLSSVKSQTYHEIEIIVVDNNSTDKTKEVAQSFTSQIYSIGPERSTQRNQGAAHAKGEYLFFLDSDMTLSKEVIHECVINFLDPRIVGIYVPEVIKGDSYWARVRNFERSFYNHTVIDAVRCIRKKTFIEVDGFDEKLYAGEDWDMDLRVRLTGKTAYTEASLIHDESDFNLKKYIQKKSYYAGNLTVYRNKWEKVQEVQLQFDPFYRYLGVFLENGNWKQFFLHPQLTFGMYFLRFIVGLSFITNK
jgi:glycosyltransferase involved in cell wall biosynthesis